MSQKDSFNKDELLAKWLDNKLTDNELRQLVPEDVFQEFVRLKQGFDLLSAMHQSKKNIRERLNEYVKQPPKKQKTKNLSLSPVFTKIAMGIAASLLLFFAYHTYSNKGLISYTSGNTQTISLQLPDGSEVILKPRSELKFDKNKWAQNRQVYLEGEAYFEVTHGNKFDVKTTQGLVSVLGTHFDVLDRNHTFSAVCYEGKVKVVAGADQKIILPQQGVQLVNKKLQTFTTALKKPYWYEDIAAFENQSLQNVLKDFSRIYHLHFDTQNIDTQIKISGGFPVNNREVALKSILKPLDISYTIQSDTLVILKKDN